MVLPKHAIAQTHPPLPAQETLPTMYDLPSEMPEDSGLPDTFHDDQGQILKETFVPPKWNSDRVFSAVDLHLYYDVENTRYYKRPDWFGAVGVPRLWNDEMRLSFVTWQERANPFVVVELLSPGTEDEDLGRTRSAPEKPPTKWQVYEQILRVPYYAVFSRYSEQLQIFRLNGGRYQPVKLTDDRYTIPELELSLGTWQGSYRGLDRLWIRWYNADGSTIPLAEERALAAERRVAEAEREAEAARSRADRLEQRLRELGIDPDGVR